MHETLFIINPVSNRGRTLKFWQAIRPELVAAGVRVKEKFTTRVGEATTLTREALSDGAQRVIAVGGDGTLNEVVNGYLDDRGQAVNQQAGIGILPSGTGSDFRRSVGLIRQEAAIRAIRFAEPRTIDALEVTYRGREGEPARRYALNMISFGLGGEVVQFVNDWRGKLPNWVGGRVRFAAGVLRALARFENRPIRITVDDGQVREIQSNVIFVANGRFAGGGMMFAPNAELDDGLADLVFADGVSRLEVLKELPRIFRGAHLNHPKVSEIKTSSLSLATNEELALDIDGEAAGFTPATVRLLPRAIRFLW